MPPLPSADVASRFLDRSHCLVASLKTGVRLHFSSDSQMKMLYNLQWTLDCEKWEFPHSNFDNLYSCCESCSVMSNSLRPHGLYSPWSSPGQNTGVGSLSFLQGIFPTLGSNSSLPHCRQILYQLSHQGSPRILEWVANPFSRGSSWPRNWTGISCIVGGFFISWATREAPRKHM